MTAGSTTPVDEEPWEAEVGAMLGRLPDVEPPAGFIDAALDHRPLHAGRTLGALLLATLGLIGLVVTTRGIERSAVVPPIDELVVRHDLAARARLPADGDEPADAGAPSPLPLPDGFQHEGMLAAEDIRQAVYARGDESVSVFLQDGPLAWSSLPGDRLTELGGLPAWVDAERRIAVIETGESTVTVVGLAPGELDRALQDVPRPSSTLGGRIEALAEAVAETFGYAPVG